ncbi:hypothetical protein [Croceicoccus marinus]|nr:hypothetical protein [Croceicoccus marinus]
MRAFLPVIAAASLVAALGGCTTMGQAGGGLAGDGAPQTAATCPDETREWAAWSNAMPGPGAAPTLIVTGKVFVPAGTSATLSAGPTDRMMPPSQRFTLALSSRPDAPGGWQPVRGEITPALAQYRSVIVGCDGAAVATITDIQTAH